MSAARFLNLLYRDCAAGAFLEVRAYPSGHRAWAPLRRWSTIAPFVNERCACRDNVALGVATRRDTSSGAASNLAELPALFGDIDRSPADAARTLDAFPFRPHIVVHSGLGVQPYWMLKEPLDLRTPKACVYASTLLRRLARVLDGDERATDPARILRLPQTLNFKYGNPRPVVLAETRPGAVDVDELDAFLPRERHGSHAFLSEGYVPEGMRNDWLFRLGRSLRARGIPIKAIVATLEHFNAARCYPSLPAAELGALLRRVQTLPDRPDFRTHAYTQEPDRSKQEPERDGRPR